MFAVGTMCSVWKICCLSSLTSLKERYFHEAVPSVLFQLLRYSSFLWPSENPKAGSG